MASAALSPAHLMTLGMFVFGMDTAAYDTFTHRIGWRHEQTERFMALPASQFVGPGETAVSLSGIVVPEIAGTYSALTTLEQMADTGAYWPLLDGMGNVLGHFAIISLDRAYQAIMAGGIPRAIAFTLELKRMA
ncbi:oxidoreductase [Novosphingobium sp. FSY-8]|uniref:Oxidoreductase n=1 Tax=Novosphingobium ovatum TaxID=1908523 RepID=A0ABW9XAH3_9SPHN|nr:phage tail protein [Novosphingobium ovatum]NBC35532.1 oxidoreductase [Novosphingobium ovatum]